LTLLPAAKKAEERKDWIHPIIMPCYLSNINITDRDVMAEKYSGIDDDDDGSDDADDDDAAPTAPNDPAHGVSEESSFGAMMSDMNSSCTTRSDNNDDNNGPRRFRRRHSSQMTNGEPEEEIARAETRCVWYLRFLTFAFLAFTTIAVAVAVHQLLRRAEEAKLAESFKDNSGKVLEAVGTILENTLMAVDSFAVSMTSYAEMTKQVNQNLSWPFVTLPHFAVRASKLRSLSKIFLFTVYHYVEHADRTKWENYTTVNKGWIDEGITTQKNDPTFRGILNEDWYSSDQINFYGNRAADADFYIVRWQASPVLVRNRIGYPSVVWNRMEC
jgi:hypothetical protein